MQKTAPFLPYQIYENLFEFLSFRKLTTNHKKLKKDIFINNINHYDYIEIPTEQNITIILIKENSDYANKSAAFNKLVLRAMNKTSISELILIANEDVNSYIATQIKQHAISNKKISMYHYDRFKIVIPNSDMVPTHEILNPTEVCDIFDYFRCKKNNFPKIKITDPMIIWLGANHGDIIKITRTSVSTGENISYRVVI